MPSRRKPTRISGFDYAVPGAYFVTICVKKRICCLGGIVNGSLVSTPESEIADRCWLMTQDHFDTINIDSNITMPNHIHAIILIHPPRRGGLTPPLLGPSLGNIVAFYKYQTTMRINLVSNTPGKRFWQDNYYDHIIRDDRDLEHYRRYILENPLLWEFDQYFNTEWSA